MKAVAQKNIANNRSPPDVREIAAKTRGSKDNAELVLKIISKGLNSKKDKKFIKCVNTLLYLIDNGDEDFKALCYERLKHLLGFEDNFKFVVLKKLVSLQSEDLPKNWDEYIGTKYNNLLVRIKQLGFDDEPSVLKTKVNESNTEHATMFSRQSPLCSH